MMMSKLTHFNQAGDAHMVDVGDKSVSHRVAVGEGRIRMLPETLTALFKDIPTGSGKKTAPKQDTPLPSTAPPTAGPV